LEVGEIKMKRWHEHWQQSQTAWDLGGPHPLTTSIMWDAQKLSGETLQGPWLIPGCGRAHDAVALLEAGANSVRGVDCVPLAIEAARLLYGEQQGAVFSCRDVCHVPEEERGYYRGIFDRAMMCALTGAERQQYIKAVAEYLTPRGLFVSLAFGAVARPESGPPFQITKSEILESFKTGWETLMLEEVVSSACDYKILKEWRFIARKQPV
jgi:hypothetical protein